MADSTIDSEMITLIDNWPGYPSRYAPPQGGFELATWQNVATAVFKVGEKFQVWNESTAGVEGMSTLIYLPVGTQNTATGFTIAAKVLCVPDSATVWYALTNDPDSCIWHTGSTLLAIAISAMTDAYYGFFWCGGVCPESHISGLGGTYPTEGNVIPGPITPHNQTLDAIGFGPVGGAAEDMCGYSIATDAA